MHHLEYMLQNCFDFIKAGKFKRAFKLLKDQWRFGCADSDIWNLNHTAAVFLLPRLKLFRKRTTSYPVGISLAEWQHILDDIIWAMERECGNTEWPIDYAQAFAEKLRFDNAMVNFGRYFDDLWW
jgi:hypothetical protein